MTSSGFPRARPAWSGAAFTVQVRTDGRLGLCDRGSHSDVPAELRRLAVALWRTGIPECRFHWRAPSPGRLCRVSLVARTDLGFDHVELSGDLVDHLPAGLSPRELP
ncbi:MULTISPECIES: hypothetical protein, partial [Pseudonocardia]